MAGRESAGAVYVTVDGDYGPLLAKLSQAEVLGRAGGQRIAYGVGAGLNAGGAEVNKYFGLFDDGGKIIASTVPKTDQLTDGIKRVGLAAKDAGSEAQSFVGLIPGLGRAAEHFINLLPGVGSAILAVFPLLGAAALLQNLISIGGVVGGMVGKFGDLTEAEKKAADEAKHVADEIESIAQKFESGEIQRAGLEIGRIASLKLSGFYEDGVAARDRAKLKSFTDQRQAAWDAMKQDRAVASLSSNPAVAAAQLLNPAETINRLMANEDWKQQADKAKKLGDEIAILTDKVGLYDQVTSKVNADKLSQAIGGESGQMMQIRLSNQERANVVQRRLTETLAAGEESIRHGARTAEIAGMADRLSASVAMAEEDFRIAQAKESRITKDLENNLKFRLDLIRKQGAAQELGKTPEQLPAIREATAGKLADETATAAQTQIEAHQATVIAQNKLDDSRAAYSREVADNLAKYWLAFEQRLESDTNQLAKDIVSQNRQPLLDIVKAHEEGIKAGGIKTQSSDDLANLRIQQAYALQIVHARADELKYARDIAAQDQKALGDRITTLQNLKTYQESKGRTNEALQTALDIERAQSALDKQRIIDATRIKELQLSVLGREIAGIGRGIPGQLGNALANGATGGGNIGQQVVQAFKGIGRDILGATLTAAIRELIIKTGLQTVATTAMQFIFPATTATSTGTLVAAGATNTATLVAAGTVNTTAIVTAIGTAAGVSGAAAGAGTAVAGAAASAATQAATGAIAPIVGGIIAAAGAIVGGVISGSISAAATFIGDAGIVKAINQTTAAVISLRVRGVGQTSSGQSPEPVAPSQGFVSSIAAGLFNSFTGSGALPVRLVAINPLIGFASLFSLFGFASGGRPAPGVPYIVGENGPELRIDDGPGTIIPSVPSGGMSRHSSLTTSSMVSNSSSSAITIGSVHLHGIRDGEQLMRSIAKAAKPRSPVFSPATR